MKYAIKISLNRLIIKLEYKNKLILFKNIHCVSFICKEIWEIKYELHSMG